MKIGDIIIAVICAVVVFIFIGKYVEEKDQEQKDIADREKAFQECVDEITNQCSATIGYAISLENENAKLNKLIKDLRNNCQR